MSDAAPASDAPATDSAASATAAPAPVSASAAPATAPADTQASTSAPADAGSLLTDDAKTDDSTTEAPDASKEGDDKADDKPKTEGAPEEYADFTLPEGVTMDLGEFKTIAKELNLPQDGAQKLVAMAAKMQQGTVDSLRTHVDTTAAEWATTARADAEIGGAKFDENLGVAKKALDTFGTPELKTLLKESRLGNHPEVIRLLTRAGKAISQDGFVPGRASPSSTKADHEVFYGNTTPSN